MRELDANVSEAFSLLQRQEFAKAVPVVEAILNAPDVNREDENILRLVNNYLIALLHLKAFAKGAAFADTIQDIASLNPDIYHNAACVYCLNGQRDKAVEQIRLARKHGGMELIRKLEKDEDLRPIFDHPGFQAAIQLRKRRAAPERFMIPEEGAAHPLFQEVKDNDVVGVYFTFADPLTAEELPLFKACLERWGMVNELTTEERGMNVASFSEGFEVYFWGLCQPRQAIETLIEGVDKIRTATMIMIIRREPSDDSAQHLRIVPNDVPEPYKAESAEDFWKHSFDTSLPMAASEDPAGMFMVIPTTTGERWIEMRPQILAFDGLRLGYGLANVENSPSDEAASRVTEVLQRNLDRYFYRDVPGLFNKQGEEDGIVDRISKDGRKGFAFAIKRENNLWAFYANYEVRNREHELFRAIRDTVHELNLSPVVHWNRGAVMIFNLWEASRT